jgi:hypothetical protein
MIMSGLRLGAPLRRSSTAKETVVKMRVCSEFQALTAPATVPTTIASEFRAMVSSSVSEGATSAAAVPAFRKSCGTQTAAAISRRNRPRSGNITNSFPTRAAGSGNINIAAGR